LNIILARCRLGSGESFFSCAPRSLCVVFACEPITATVASLIDVDQLVAVVVVVVVVVEATTTSPTTTHVRGGAAQGRAPRRRQASSAAAAAAPLVDRC
jgi:hypothetical protein